MRRRLRPWALLLLLYTGVDFLDPAVPGISFFDPDQLFVISMAELKPIPPPPAPDRDGTGRLEGWAEGDSPRPAMTDTASRATPGHWARARRDVSPASASASPDDH